MLVLDIADHIGDHVRHQCIELNNKSGTQSESKAETKTETKCIGSESASETDSERFRQQMEQNLVSHQDDLFKDHGRGGDRLGSRLPLHGRIKLLKT